MANSEKVKILIDGFWIGKYSGYGRFIFEMCNALSQVNSEFDISVLVPRSAHGPLPKFGPGVSIIAAPKMPGPIWEQIILPAYALFGGFRVLHSPFNTRPIIVGPQRTVTTVHDLTFLIEGAERDWKAKIIHAYMKISFFLGSVRSKVLISVSDTTGNHLKDIGFSSTTVYNTVDAFLETKKEAGCVNSRPYFVHRGSYAQGHRNTKNIIDAFLSREYLSKNFELRIFGIPQGAEYWGLAPDSGVTFLSRVTDAELATIYSEAVAVVAVSILEGFCLPIIEGFGFGVPVISSDIDPMKEIAGDGAILVSPDRPDEIADAMVRVGENAGLREQLIAAGSRRIKDFSYEAMADGLLSVYRSVA